MKRIPVLDIITGLATVVGLVCTAIKGWAETQRSEQTMTDIANKVYDERSSKTEEKP